MRKSLATLCLFPLLFLAMPSVDAAAPPKRPDDYAVVSKGDAIRRAFFYGSKTVVELNTRPFNIEIKGARGERIEYESIDRYLRINTKPDEFTITADGALYTLTLKDLVPWPDEGQRRHKSKPITFTIAAGESLQTALRRWCDQANWKDVSWEYPTALLSRFEATAEGSIEEALGKLESALRAEGLAIRIAPYPDNKIVRVSGGN